MMRRLFAVLLAVLLLPLPASAQQVIVTRGNITAELHATDRTALANVDTDLTTLIGHADGLEALLTTQNGYLDGLELLVDGLEALLTTQNGYLDGLEGSVDGLETSVDGLETLLSTQAGYLDGLEGLLTTQAGYLDGLEGLLTTMDADTSEMVTSLESIAVSLDNIEGQLSADAVHGNAVLATGPQDMLEAADFDGSSLPNVVGAEGQSVRAKASLYGVQYVMLTGEDGSAVGTVNVSNSGTFQTQIDSAAVTSLGLIDDDQTGATGLGVTSVSGTNSTNVKSSAGRLMGMFLTNTTTTTYYIRFYNLASAPTCSSGTGHVFAMAVPPAGAAGQAGGFSMPFGPSGMAFTTGISYCITGGGTSTDNTNAASGIFGVLAYK